MYHLQNFNQWEHRDNDEDGQYGRYIDLTIMSVGRMCKQNHGRLCLFKEEHTPDFAAFDIFAVPMVDI